MMVMAERLQDLREMQVAASNRRESLLRKLELSEEVARRRERAELSAMSAEDSKEKLVKDFHALTQPMEPAGSPPGKKRRESSDSDNWGPWRPAKASGLEVQSPEETVEPKTSKKKGKKPKKGKKKASSPARRRRVLKKAKKVAEDTLKEVNKELESRGHSGAGSSKDLPPLVEQAMEATVVEAGGDKGLRKARTQLGAATFAARFQKKKAAFLSAQLQEKQVDLKRKELQAAVLALREAEANVKIKELELALAEAGGVDMELEMKDIEAGNLEKKTVEAGDLEKKAVEAENLEQKNVEAGDLEKKTVEAGNLEKKTVEAVDLEVKDVEVVDLEGGAPVVGAPCAPVEVKAMPSRPAVVLRPASRAAVKTKAMPSVRPTLAPLPPPPPDFVGTYQLLRPPLFGPPTTGRTQVPAAERTPETPAPGTVTVKASMAPRAKPTPKVRQPVPTSSTTP